MSQLIELQISSETLHKYREFALDHLQQNNAFAEVAKAGVDKHGNPVFGIRVVTDQSEEWYDLAEVGERALLGWQNKNDAELVLLNKVLPNLGYAIYQRDLQQFHRNM